MTFPGISMTYLFNWLIESSFYVKGKPFFFTDGFFIIFLLLFLSFYTLTAESLRRRMWVILIFSLWFYYKSAGLLVMVLVLTALFSWLFGKLIHRTRFKSVILAAGVILLVSNLALFKYSAIYDQFSEVLRTLSLSTASVVFPIGLSFYTFSNLSYLIDIKRGKILPESSFLTYLSFIAFFPVVQMGPIERAGNLITALKQTPKITKEDATEGFRLILSGALKKMVIGDFINNHLVTNIFSAPERFSGLENLAAVLGYSLVIYCDFSGYTDMARGLARWMGIRIGLNFNFPYKSWNIGEFWRRWHISLSSWLRDYIFMPVAMKLSSLWKPEFLVSGKYLRTDLVIFVIASVLTLFICGVWHGTGINFLLWGLMHGVALSVQKIWNVSTKKFRQNRSAFSRKFNKTTGIILTFSFVTAGWVFFRMDTPEKSLLVFSQIAGNFAPELIPAFVVAYYPALLMMLLGYSLHFMPENAWLSVNTRFQTLNSPAKLLLAISAIGIIFYFHTLGSSMPIYIQF